jgi:hypothetical protein
MAERELQWRLTLDGIQESLRSIDALEKRVKTLEGSTRAFTAATRDSKRQVDVFDTSNRQLGKSVEGVTKNFGKVGSALTQTAPLFGQFVGQVGAAGGAVGQLGGAVGGLASGFGLVGIAVGAAAATITTIISLVIEAREEMKNLSRATVAAARSFDQMQAAISQEDARTALRSRLSTGAASPLEYRAEVRRLEEESMLADINRRNLQEQLDGTVGDAARDALARQIANIDRSREALRNERSQAIRFLEDVREDERLAAQEERDAALNDPPSRGGRRRSGGGQSRTPRPAEKGAGAAGEMALFIADEAARRTAESGRSLEKDHESAVAQRELEERLKDQTSWQKDLGDAGVKAAVETSEAWTTALTEVNGLFGEVYDRAISGEMSFGQALKEGTKVWLQQFSYRQGKLALEAIAEGTGLLFVNPPAAGAKFAAAALHGALAVGAGVGASALGGGASRGGNAQANGRDRVLGTGVRDSGRGGNTYVINVGTFAVATKAEVGREIRGVLREAERFDGVSR